MSIATFFQKDTSISRTGRGVISGVIGGLAGTAVKSLVEKFVEVRKIEHRSAQIKIIDDLSTKITGSPISVQNEALAEELLNFPVGASLGAAYGYKHRDKDDFDIANGVILGGSTWISTHPTSLPLLGLEAKAVDVPIRMQANELFAHLLFGITTEVVRSYVNKSLKK